MKKLFLLSLITVVLSSCTIKSKIIQTPLSVVSHTMVPFNPGISYYVDKSKKVSDTYGSSYFMPFFLDTSPRMDVNEMVKKTVQAAGEDCVGLSEAAVLYRGECGILLGSSTWIVEGYPIRKVTK